MESAIAVPPRKRVLVADDQAVNRKLTTQRLEQLGFAVDVVENGLQAIEAVTRANYDLIFMDCQMPHLDGLRAAEWIRKREGPERHTPIIAFTASLAGHDRERCLAVGMDDMVSKPADEAEFLRVIRRWIPDVDVKALNVNLDELLEIYFADAPKRLLAIREALRARDAVRLADAAHAFKSGSGTVGALQVYELCGRLESTARTGDLAASPKIVDELEAQYRLAEKALRK